jgi:hypothetical protein
VRVRPSWSVAGAAARRPALRQLQQHTTRQREESTARRDQAQRTARLQMLAEDGHSCHHGDQLFGDRHQRQRGAQLGVAECALAQQKATSATAEQRIHRPVLECCQCGSVELADHDLQQTRGQTEQPSGGNCHERGIGPRQVGSQPPRAEHEHEWHQRRTGEAEDRDRMRLGRRTGVVRCSDQEQRKAADHERSADNISGRRPTMLAQR